MGDPAFFTQTDANGDEVIMASETETIEVDAVEHLVHVMVLDGSD
jgi:hypothetical protein